MAETAKQAIAAKLQWQADACRMIGSELYAGLLERAVDDVEAGGPTWEILRGHEDDPQFSVLGLRLLGAVNRLVLTGQEPALADAYAGGGGGGGEAWERLRDALARNAAGLRDSVDHPVQTNEVGRSAVLLFGFLTVYAETGLPLRLLEVGASAGLNLRWDRYRYEADGFSWGPEGSPVKLEFELEGQPPQLPLSVEIASRRGCDASPIDPATEEGRLTLLTYIWPDQKERIVRMRSALAVADEVPVTLDREPAAAWAQRMLAERVPGQATVIYHSIVSQYLSEGERAELFETIRDAGARATADAPLAWLHMEPGDDRADVHLTLWPGGEDRHLARAGYHGTPVRLL
ncbi:MAG TPA: DUF2332 domain-containing protein [Solirubrobacterales bacterium]|nr:DUF2332 domain-containing protein [Solirubrobacterales bacterium]